jgi:hypothetical protein
MLEPGLFCIPAAVRYAEKLVFDLAFVEDQFLSDPKLLTRSGKNHSGSGQLRIRNEFEINTLASLVFQQNAQLKKYEILFYSPKYR